MLSWSSRTCRSGKDCECPDGYVAAEAEQGRTLLVLVPIKDKRLAVDGDSGGGAESCTEFRLWATWTRFEF